MRARPYYFVALFTGALFLALPIGLAMRDARIVELCRTISAPPREMGRCMRGRGFADDGCYGLASGEATACHAAESACDSELAPEAFRRCVTGQTSSAKVAVSAVLPVVLLVMGAWWWAAARKNRRDLERILEPGGLRRIAIEHQRGWLRLRAFATDGSEARLLVTPEEAPALLAVIAGVHGPHVIDAQVW